MEPVAVTIYIFLQKLGGPDLDNAAKTILDALSRFLIGDDKQVMRLVVQKFEAEAIVEFDNPDPELAAAIAHEADAVYIRVSADLYEPLYG